MPVEAIHTYLVHPNKGVDDPEAIGGANVPLNGKVFSLLRGVYENTDDECTIDISFNRRNDGEAQNDCRTLICSHLDQSTVASGRAIAERLSSFTTRRSGLGLLFLVHGQQGPDKKLVIARFPANSGILAEQGAKALTLSFLERVFMRSAFAYKAVAYQDASIRTGFWAGRAVDRQINSSEIDVSRYWVTDFLASDFRTTSAAGTKRLAVAMRDAGRTAPDLEVRTEIAAAARLATNLNGQMLSAAELGQRFGLSDRAVDAISRQFRHPNLVNEQFRFDAPEFSRQVPLRSVRLDTGAILMADAKDFDEIFEQEPLPGDAGIKFSTIGNIITERLEKAK